MGGLALNLIELDRSCFIHFGYSSCIILMIKYLMFKKNSCWIKSIARSPLDPSLHA